MPNEYTSIQIRIRASLEKSATRYLVEAILDDGSQFLDGQMQLTQEDLEDLLVNVSDPEKYGKKLFNVLFSESIREAYDKVTARAEVQTEGRLRVRLWIDDSAAELHAFLWERLYHKHKGQMVPLAASILTPFSRYIGLPVAEPQPINISPIRLLLVISNPLNLPCGLHPIDVEQEIKNLQQALGDLRRVNYVQVTLMPGRSGLSSVLRTQLELDGYQVLDNVTSLDNILRSLPGCHVLHFLGHGFFEREAGHGEGTAALYLEKENGSCQVVKDNDLVLKLIAAEHVPHLVFLSACKSAQQDAKAFVGLGPKLIKAGVPAVVAMQDLAPMNLVRQLTDDFYRNLIEHGIIDLALNQARLLLFDRGTPNWSIPVLFTRLEQGQLFTTRADVKLQSNLLSSQLNLTAGSASFHSPGRCDYYAHISIPPNYVERTDVLMKVRKALLTNTPDVALTSAIQYNKADALHGMGGIGKTVIARGLCDDRDIQAVFPDGILWVTLGKEPELIPRMREWITVLGGTISENAPTVNSLKMTLAQLLRNRACLLILDDIWRRTDADAFRIGGSRCRLLFTTRDAEIARELGAKVQPIPVMTQIEAVSLLEEWADGHLIDADPTLKNQIVERLGYLPLAVKLAGAQLRRRLANEWLATFNIRKLKAPRQEDLHDNLELTFKLSLDVLDEEARRLYLALAIFKEDEPIPQVGIKQLWQSLADLDVDATMDLLDDLADRALLEVSPDNFSDKRIVQLHDLLRDLISVELGDERITTNQALLNIYRTKLRDESWHTANDDGYLYDHLAFHLQAVHAIDELKGLFVDQRWLHVRVPQRDYTYDGYLADLSLASEYAYAEVSRQIDANQEPGAFADCVRYLLIRTSINGIAENYIPELIARAVEVGLWTPRRALSVAARVPSRTKQAWMSLVLLRTGSLSREQQEEALRLGLRATLALTNQRKRAQMLIALVPLLTIEQRTQLLEWALKTALVLDEREYARVLITLVPQLTGGLLERALKAALALTDEQARGRVLAALAPQLTGELLMQALEATLALRHKRTYAKALAALAPQLPTEQRTEVLKLAMEATLVLTDEKTHMDVLVALAPQLTGELLARALEAVLALIQERARAQVLVALVPQLTGELLARALEAVLVLTNKQAYAKALVALAPQLSIEQQTELLNQALEAARALTDEQTRAGVLATLAPQLTGELLAQALEAARALTQGSAFAQVLVALAPQLTGKLLERALEAALALTDEQLYAKVLTALAPQLTGKLLERALEAALALTDEQLYAKVLTALAPQLTGKLLERALGDALELKRERTYVKVLVALAPLLPTEQWAEILERVLETALALTNERAYAEVLAALAPQLTGRLLERALEAALVLTSTRRRGQVLMALAPQLTGKLLERALKAALALTTEWVRAQVLVALTPQLMGELLEQALEAALMLKNKQAYTKVLATFAPQLPKEQRIEVLNRVLEAARALTNEQTRAGVLAALAPQLTGESLARALEVALALRNEQTRAGVLAALAPQLTGELLARALEVALALTNKQAYAKALVALAPQLSIEQQTELLNQALEAALTSMGENARARILAALAPQLTGELLVRALEIALTTKNEPKLAEAVMALAPQLKGQLLEQALEAVLMLRNRRAYVQVLAALAPSLIIEKRTQVQKQVLEVGLASTDEKIRAEVLTILVPQLSGELLERALGAWLELTDQQVRVEILDVFLHHLSKQSLLLQPIRQVTKDYLLFIQHWSRQDVFQHYLIKGLLKPPICSLETLGSMILYIVEICQEWNWL
jgi:CHAT domain/NB-ARC domain